MDTFSYYIYPIKLYKKRGFKARDAREAAVYSA